VREEVAVRNLAEVDYFTDLSLIPDPYPYFEWLREQGPVVFDAHRGVVMVTGLDEAVEVWRDTDNFSSANCVGGPFPGLPVALEGDDIDGVIEAHRRHFPMWEYLITFDGAKHLAHRALMMRLLTPKRMKENEEYMWRLADRQMDEILAFERCEFIGDYAQPFALLVIADLLGVPDGDREAFKGQLRSLKAGAVANTRKESGRYNPLAFLEETFTRYVEDRRQAPRRDLLTRLAAATFPDGSTPDVAAVVRTATFLFAAGQETSAKLLGTELQILVDRPDLQALLREHPGRIPDFTEETLRLEPPTKADFRIARRTTTLAGVRIPAGKVVVILIAAANRDPRRFDDPASFDLDRPNLRDHVAFARGVHSCPGNSLARAEANVSLTRILERTSDIRCSEAVHGPRGDRRYDYDPTYIMRGLRELHLEFAPK
jgi:cytochrome P450